MKILTLTLLSLFICNSTAEEIERKKNIKTKVNDKLIVFVNDYWKAALKKDQKKLKKFADSDTQFSIDMALAQKLKDKKFKIVPTFFEKVANKKNNNTYLFSYDFYENKKVIYSRYECQVVEKKEDSYLIIGTIGDCVE